MNIESNNDGNSSEIYSEPESNYARKEVKKKKPNGGKKRQREKMTRTGCKSRIVVNLIDERWHVTYFMADHNHHLVVKNISEDISRISQRDPTAREEVYYSIARMQPNHWAHNATYE